MNHLIDGFFKFKKDIFPAKCKLFRDLAQSQSPHTLFVTCADSRIVPNLITHSDPGSLFVCRNVGNQVPPFGCASSGGVASSIEYAVQVLGVEHVAICGHTNCGAMNAILHPENLEALPSTAGWLESAEAARSVVLENYKGLPEEVQLHLLTEENIIAQIGNLKTYPAIATRLAAGKLQLHGWLYHIHSGEIVTYNAEKGLFAPVGKEMHNVTPTRRIQYEPSSLEVVA